MTAPAVPSARIPTLSQAEFDARFDAPGLNGTRCGCTHKVDTRTVIVLLAHARPWRVLEVGKALGHLTANLTRLTADDAEIYTINIQPGMSKTALGAAAQQVEIPGRTDWGRFAGHCRSRGRGKEFIRR
jgi:predicted O-methyltransferase YrrM